MELNLTFRDIEPTDAIKEFISKKTKKLEKLIPKLESIKVTATKENYFFVVEMMIRSGFSDLYAKESTKDLYNSITRAISDIERQIKKNKEKVRNR